eukprot:TRINITY_DN67496_c10_g4_i1.p2 TRINITY_DN67496_c10_g4~~TRINITY_DN67496_c10_g4_i1.p2  ORF type:complete len:100 (-),score=2.71 TRINITY_DN67496_c10_g4_i1:345-644(-)
MHLTAFDCAWLHLTAPDCALTQATPPVLLALKHTAVSYSAWWVCPWHEKSQGGVRTHVSHVAVRNHSWIAISDTDEPHELGPSEAVHLRCSLQRLSSGS